MTSAHGMSRVAGVAVEGELEVLVRPVHDGMRVVFDGGRVLCREGRRRRVIGLVAKSMGAVMERSDQAVP